MSESARTDRRREPRQAATGPVTISVTNGVVRTFEGELVDLSASGFRIAHAEQSLERGADVEFRHEHAQGKARVVWNRLSDGRAETGFVIL
jgi:hypothetical protein